MGVRPAEVGRVGPAVIDSVGLAVAAVGCVVLAMLGPSSSYWSVLIGLLIVGAGMGLANTPATTAIATPMRSGPSVRGEGRCRPEGSSAGRIAG